MDNITHYNLTVSKNQARVIMVALESFFRVRMGQHFDLASDVALNGYVYNKDDPDNDRKFNDYINRRNDAMELYDQAYNIAAPDYSKRWKTPDIQNAIDIWHVIRHQFWKENPNRRNDTTDSYPPFPTCDEELIKIERIEK